MTGSVYTIIVLIENCESAGTSPDSEDNREEQEYVRAYRTDYQRKSQRL